MTRDEIIRVFLVRAALSEREEISEKLYGMTKGELEEAYRVLQIQAKEDELLRIQAEIAAERELFRLSREPQRKAEAERQEKQDRETFKQAAKTLRSFAVNEASFNVCRTTLGEGFSTFQIEQMLAANGAVLSPPTQEEMNEWTRLEIEAENSRLLSLDIPSLRKLAREAGANIAGARPAMDETQRVRAASRDDGITYPPLPEEIRIGDREELLDAAFIKRCSRETYKFLLKRYGSAQIDEALRTRRSDVSPLW